MENCVVYSHNLAFDNVIAIVKKRLPQALVEVQDGGKEKSLTASTKGGFFSKPKMLKIRYRERLNPSWRLDKIECGFTQNLEGMGSYIISIPAGNIPLRNKLLYKVGSINCEMSFVAEPGFDSQLKSLLCEIASEIDAFIFAQPGGIFNRSTVQHFTDPSLRLILDANGRSGVSDISVKIDTKYTDGDRNYNAEQLERKSATEKMLQEHKIPFNKNLPCQPGTDQVKIRSVSEIVERAFALMVIAARGEGVEMEDLDTGIRDKRITGFTPKEMNLLQSKKLTEQEGFDAAWRYESLNTLLWALGIIPQLPYPDQTCEVPEILMAILEPSREAFENNIRMRTPAEILDETDKIYRFHWACVDARIKGKPAPGKLVPSVVYERHYALNWLTCNLDLDWDQVQTNT